MRSMYIEFFYKHSLTEMICWGAGLVLVWMVLSIVFRRWPKFWKWMNLFLFCAVVVFILWRTVGNRAVGKREICLIPFYSFVAARSSPERYRSLVANFLLFIPFGLTLPFCLKRHPVCRTISFAAVFSLLIELTQYIWGLGLCETDDVIFNTLGAAFGTLAFVIQQQMTKYRSER